MMHKASPFNSMQLSCACTTGVMEHVSMTRARYTSCTLGIFTLLRSFPNFDCHHKPPRHHDAQIVTPAIEVNTRRTTSLLQRTRAKHVHDRSISNEGRCEQKRKHSVKKNVCNISLQVHDLGHGTCVEFSVIWHLLKCLAHGGSNVAVATLRTRHYYGSEREHVCTCKNDPATLKHFVSCSPIITVGGW